jgi:folate-binding Fe-S cluster repair protein YgfZ
MSAGTNPDGTWSALDELGVLRVAGADASLFLQGQVSNDLARLGRERALL